MGVYYDLVVKTNNNVYKIQTMKYSLGVGIYAFEKDDFVFIPKKKYYVETTIEKAINNMESFLNELINTMNSSEHLDVWSNTLCKNKIKEIKNMIERLERFSPKHKLFSDMSEAVMWYGEKELADFTPGEDLNSSKSFLLDVASGKHNGLHTEYNVIQKQNDYINSVIEEIVKDINVKIDRIVQTSSSEETRGINMGPKRMMKCTRSFIFKKEEKVKDYNAIDHYTLPVFAALQKKNIFLETTFDKVYAKVEEDEVAYKCNLYWEEI